MTSSSVSSNAQYLVRSEVTEVRFGLYSEEEIKALSVCLITSPIALDKSGTCIKNGLYDLRLGPRDQQSHPCVTCGQIYLHCPGHCGHIELTVPVYHPLHFASLYMLLRAKCSVCHALRMSKTRVRHILLKLKLLEMNDTEGASQLDAMVIPPTVTKEEDSQAGHASDLAMKLTAIEDRYNAFKKASLRGHGHGVVKDQRAYQMQKELIASFVKSAAAVRKCEGCGASSASLRKDGYSKIYQKPLPKRQQLAMTSLRVKARSALETIESREEGGGSRREDSDEEEEEEEGGINGDGEEEDANEDGGAASAGDKYLAPLEVEAQMELLWEKSGDILAFIWDRALGSNNSNKKKKSEAWRLFFIRTLLVPPNRFRPPSVLGTGVAEHPQNIVLNNVLKANELIEKQRQVKGEGEAAMDMAKLLTNWVALQNAVNGYIDADKDGTKSAANNVSGIRQLLERKEGLFRRHMMGKVRLKRL